MRVTAPFEGHFTCPKCGREHEVRIVPYAYLPPELQQATSADEWDEIHWFTCVCGLRMPAEAVLAPEVN